MNTDLGRKRMSQGSPDRSFWDSKEVLVTGATGFAGRNLCSLLSNVGSKVRCLVRSKNDFFSNEPGTSIVLGDMQDYQSVLDALKGVDVAFQEDLPKRPAIFSQLPEEARE